MQKEPNPRCERCIHAIRAGHGIVAVHASCPYKSFAFGRYFVNVGICELCAGFEEQTILTETKEGEK